MKADRNVDKANSQIFQLKFVRISFILIGKGFRYERKILCKILNERHPILHFSLRQGDILYFKSCDYMAFKTHRTNPHQIFAAI